jgi:hypothetical protein
MCASFRSKSRRSLALVLAIGASMAACGTEHIELNPSEPAATPLPETSEPPPGPVEPALSQPLSTDGAAAIANSRAESVTRLPDLIETGLRPNSFAGLDPTTTPLGPDPGCSKVDFLFVVDNSASMREEQAALVKSFPGFVDVVQQAIDTDDFHIMIVDTDGQSFADIQRDPPSGQSDPCEPVRGAGKRLSENGDSCGFATDDRFISAGQPNLEQTFACVAQVGTDGSDLEHPVDAMLEAISAPLEAPGACNAGFLRSDAMLVVTLITDEDDRRSEGDPADWEKALIAAKRGDPGSVVMLGILSDRNLDDGICRGLDTREAPRLQTLARDLGLAGSICAEDYAPFFQQAVGWIAARCAEFVPPLLR